MSSLLLCEINIMWMICLFAVGYRASSSLVLKFQLLTSRSCFGNEDACIVVLIIRYWPDMVIEKHYKALILFDYFPSLMEMVAFYFAGMPTKRAF